MFYRCQAWDDKMGSGEWKPLEKSQRTILTRVISAYRTVATDALNILSRIPPPPLTSSKIKNAEQQGVQKERNIVKAREETKQEL